MSSNNQNLQLESASDSKNLERAALMNVDLAVSPTPNAGAERKKKECNCGNCACKDKMKAIRG